MIIYFINNEDFRGDSFNILRDSFGFTLHCSVTGGENWQNVINQSDTKVKRLLAWLHAFSRASRSLRVYSSVPHWLLVMFFFVLIGYWDKVNFSFDQPEPECLDGVKR